MPSSTPVESRNELNSREAQTQSPSIPSSSIPQSHPKHQQDQRRPRHLDLSADKTTQLLAEQQSQRPPIAAAFLVRFHVKTGYTIDWQRSTSGLSLDNSVEYKSLPSGLHNVKRDIIYFTHQEGRYTGISAFLQQENENTDLRKTDSIAVGVLLPSASSKNQGFWTFAEDLPELARKIAADPSNQSLLNSFWETNCLDESVKQNGRKITGKDRASQAAEKSRAASPRLSQRTRSSSRSSGMAYALHHGLRPADSPHHPIRSLGEYLDTFGPLVFPLYKAALLRERILLVGQPPVQRNCNFAYDISLLSRIPTEIAKTLPLVPLPIQLDQRFSLGIHDYDELRQHSGSTSSLGANYGWVACTSDDIMADKTQIYDYVVQLRSDSLGKEKRTSEKKHWPRIMTNKGMEVKASQRDLRRYRVLRKALRHYDRQIVADANPDCHSPASQPGMSASLMSTSALDLSRSLTLLNEQSGDIDRGSLLGWEVTEAQSWSALAYDSFMWWASAGSRRTDRDEEEQHDAALMRDSSGRVSSVATTPSAQLHFHDDESDRQLRARSPGCGRMSNDDCENLLGGSSLDTDLVAIFARLTTTILSRLGEIVDEADARADAEDSRATSDEDDEATGPLLQGAAGDLRSSGEDIDTDEDDMPIIQIDGDDMTHMGLDSWSETDRTFVAGLLALYWGRRSCVEGDRIECCGIRLL